MIGNDSTDVCCPFLLATDKHVKNSSELKEMLEKGDDFIRQEAMKMIILLHLNGEPQNHHLMTVIKYVTPIQDHLTKKLLLYFWEIIGKTDSEGKLIPEMILICSFLRNDLQHPNVYVCGITLRFLSKLEYRELIEPLVSIVVNCLKHPLGYVRRHAILAFYNIYRNFPDLLPNAFELLNEFLTTEIDGTAMGYAFDMFALYAKEQALGFLIHFSEEQDISTFSEAFQRSILNFIDHAIRGSFTESQAYITLLLNMLRSPFLSIRYQCARILSKQHYSKSALLQATQVFVQLLQEYPDNSIRIVIIEEIGKLCIHFADEISDVIMDLLPILAKAGLELRSRMVRLAANLVNSRYIRLFLHYMKKELSPSGEEYSDHIMDKTAYSIYECAVLEAIHASILQCPSEAYETALFLVNICLSHRNTSMEAIIIICDVLSLCTSEQQDTLLEKLASIVNMIKWEAVIERALWTLGAYGSTETLIENNLLLFREQLDFFLQIVSDDDLLKSRSGSNIYSTIPEKSMTNRQYQTTTVVGADGTYITSQQPIADLQQLNPLKSGQLSPATSGLLDDQDLFEKHIGMFSLSETITNQNTPYSVSNLFNFNRRGRIISMLILSYTRLLIRYLRDFTVSESKSEYLISEIRRLIGGVLSTVSKQSSMKSGSDMCRIIDVDSETIIRQCLLIIEDPTSSLAQIWLKNSLAKAHKVQLYSRTRFVFLSDKIRERMKSSKLIDETPSISSPSRLSLDTPLSFFDITSDDHKTDFQVRQLSKVFTDLRLATQTEGLADVSSTSLGVSKFTPFSLSNEKDNKLSKGCVSSKKYFENLRNIKSLSAYNAPIHCEASVTINEFDAIIYWSLYNTTNSTLDPVSLDISFVGDLHISERPQQIRLIPYGTAKIRTSFKLDTVCLEGISGAIFYHVVGSSETPVSVVYLDALQFNILDFIYPTSCNETTFRSLWEDLDWENKVTVVTNLKNMNDYIIFLCNILHMQRVDSRFYYSGVFSTNGQAMKSGNDNISNKTLSTLDRHEISEKENNSQLCEFLNACIYAKTVFGEYIVGTVFLEQEGETGQINGVVRLRSHQRNIAMCLGNELMSRQRESIL